MKTYAQHISQKTEETSTYSDFNQTQFYILIKYVNAYLLLKSGKELSFPGRIIVNVY